MYIYIRAALLTAELLPFWIIVSPADIRGDGGTGGMVRKADH